METKISKAQQKRDQDLKNRISSMIKNNLMDFQDLYLFDFAEYQESKLQKEVNFYQGLIDDPKKLEKYNEHLLSLVRESRRAWFEPKTIKTIQWHLGRAEKDMLFPSLRKMSYFNEAKSGYDQKIEKVIDTVFSYRPDMRFLKIERVSDAGHKFSFLISNNDMEIHARVIYACGEVNAPHYRFIVTKRNK